ncbi:hypothetical protein CLOM_g20910 [Closterium sp. NIES-68]|nr:hypothetical protein CLOM_g20910 [Closterium sp. NIES-68]GJP72993.1 hypothetical protein CLOP_g3756 [Closterium sp. NIES-67]
MNTTSPEQSRHAELARLAAKLKDLFEREKFTDVVFEARDGTKIAAHCNIIALWSPVLESMLEDWTDEEDENPVFKLADVDGHTLRLLLAFMYGFDVTPNADALKQHGLALLEAAHKFDVADLADKLDRQLCAVDVEERSLLRVLKAVDRVGATRTKHALINHITHFMGSIKGQILIKEMTESSDTHDRQLASEIAGRPSPIPMSVPSLCSGRALRNGPTGQLSGRYGNTFAAESPRLAELARLAAKLKDLLEGEKFTDVIFEAGDGTKIAAHRNIVTLWSPVVESTLDNLSVEHDDTPVFKLGDVDAHTMRLLLTFMYGADVTLGAKALKQHGLALFEAAQKYDIADLAENVDRQLSAMNVEERSLLRVLKAVDRAGARRTKQALFYRITHYMDNFKGKRLVKEMIESSDPHDRQLANELVAIVWPSSY